LFVVLIHWTLAPKAATDLRRGKYAPTSVVAITAVALTVTATAAVAVAVADDTLSKLQDTLVTRVAPLDAATV
jgi:hypothetical protein